MGNYEITPPNETGLPDLDSIADAISATYDQFGGLNHLCGTNLPSKPAIAGICEDLLRIMFPGFHDDSALRDHQVGELTRQRVRCLGERLHQEICKSLRTTDPSCPEASAGACTMEFLRKLPHVRSLLHTDIEAAYEGDPAAGNFEEIILSYPSIEAVAIQRMAHLLYTAKVPLLPRIMTEWAHSRTGIDIHPGASIGTHFFIDHGTGVVIGETCRIGNRVKLYHAVTLGARSFQRDESGNLVKGGKRHPDVESNVTIYPNSTILGGETVIGEGTTVGANVFLMHSVPARSLVFLEEKQVQIVPKR
jgi:serine O-acetyltransferase